MKRGKGLLITIDGPSGAGKSTVGKALAERLSYGYLDTGALYRAVAYQALKDGIDVENKKALSDFLKKGLNIFIKNINGTMKVFIGNNDVSEYIRNEDIGLVASKISAYASVRMALLEVQRDAGHEGAVIAEGRDMGSIVFPEAEVKFFLDAKVEERIMRRYRELTAMGASVDYQTVENDLKLRDKQDSERDIAPLKIPEGAIIIDSSNMNSTDVVENMMDFIEKKTKEEKRCK